MIYVILCAVIAICVGIYLFFKWKYTYWSRIGVPYLEPKFPYGNLKNSKDSSDLQNKICAVYNAFKGKAPFAGIYILAAARAVIVDIELIRNILIKDFTSFHDRGLYYNTKVDPLTGHLFLLEGERWKTLRHKLSPTFTTGKMKFMFPTVVQVGEEFSKTLASMVEHESVIELKDVIARFSTDVIGTCAFGIQCNSLKDPNAEFRVYGRKLFTNPAGGNLGFLIRSSFKGLAKVLGLRNLSPEITKFFLGVVEETVAYREENNVRRNDFLDLLIQLKNSGELEDGSKEYLGKLSIKEMAAQVFVFFAAGFETSSTTMSFSLYEMASNLAIQEKARKEIQDVLKKHNGQFTYEAMADMKYLDQIINETLRKHPVVAVLLRTATENYNVPGSDKVIEKGTSIFIPARAIHHDPEFYPNPDVFDPERFSPEHTHSRDPMTFLPFGDGPRHCIGMRFGQMQTRIGLAFMLLNFKFELAPEYPFKTGFFNFLTQLSSGLHLKVTKLR